MKRLTYNLLLAALALTALGFNFAMVLMSAMAGWWNWQAFFATAGCCGLVYLLGVEREVKR